MGEGQVYLVGVLEGCYKIGRSGDSEKRLLSYSPKLPVTLTIHHRINTHDSSWLEMVLHTAFSHRRSLGEWFRLDTADLELIKSLITVTRKEHLPKKLRRLFRLNKPSQPRSSKPKSIVIHARPKLIVSSTASEVQTQPTKSNKIDSVNELRQPQIDRRQAALANVDFVGKSTGTIGETWANMTGYYPLRPDRTIQFPQPLIYYGIDALERFPCLFWLDVNVPGKHSYVFAYKDTEGQPREFMLRHDADADQLVTWADVFGREDIDPLIPESRFMPRGDHMIDGQWFDDLFPDWEEKKYRK